MIITEDYVSFEIAKLLKEKGFNEDSWFHYDADGDIVTRGYRLNMPEDIPAWTLQMAMKWLREVHDVIVNVFYNKDEERWCAEHYRMLIDDYTLIGYYNTYEQACEAAIRYCLENLI